MIYRAEDFTSNKLNVLYLLSNIKAPISLSQLTHFILEQGYCDYFLLQQTLTQLEEANLIKKELKGHTSLFKITYTGRDTIILFHDRIPPYIKKEIDTFIFDNKPFLQNNLDVSASFTKEKEHEYLVSCKVTENATTLLELNINVTTNIQANTICNRWKSNTPEIYSEILYMLTKKI
ncbi:MAG: hypothetical protein BEN19_04945 [Epulopiscium sp. Nuni2H_MBin003]|nr:MAG: hypothetical protein BEN19_04945 [Epulopiscium sp. Nuni2H_MBin003]